MRIDLRHRLISLVVAFLAAVGMAAEIDAGVWYGSSVGDERWVVEQDNHYYPYGMLMGESSNILISASKQRLTFTGGLNPYRFGSKEYLTTNGANLLDFTARTYDPATLLFQTQDPKSTKFTSFNTYLYCGGNSINKIDPDGQEGIVISGSPGDHKNKLHFLVNGLDRAVKTKKMQKNVTWIIYNDVKKGFNPSDLKKYVQKASKGKINVKVVSSTDDIVDYINNKNGGESRKQDKISAFYYVGHATPGDLDVGYSGSGEDFDATDLDSDAFSNGCTVNLVGGCRTAVNDYLIGIIPIERSLVNQFAKILDATSVIYGSNVRVIYPGGVVKDEDLVKPKNGKIIKENGAIEN